MSWQIVVELVICIMSLELGFEFVVGWLCFSIHVKCLYIKNMPTMDQQPQNNNFCGNSYERVGIWVLHFPFILVQMLGEQVGNIRTKHVGKMRLNK